MITRSISCTIFFYYFKQFPLKAKHNFESSSHLIVRERLISVVKVVVSVLVDKPLDIHDITFQYF